MTQHLDDCFSGMVETDNQLWDLLNQCSADNISPKDMDFELEITVNGLNLSSKSKASFAKALVGVNAEQQFIPKNNEYICANKTLLDDFFAKHVDDIVPTKFGPQTHDLMTINFDELTELLEKFHFSDDEPKCNIENLYRMARTLNISSKTRVEILKMIRPDGKEERSTINENSNKLVGLLQGYSVNKSPLDDDFYAGDRYLSNDKFMVQIHYVALKNDIHIKESNTLIKRGTICPMIA